jgi:hypothetical protein
MFVVWDNVSFICGIVGFVIVVGGGGGYIEGIVMFYRLVM